jgi:hypothetical protein
MSGTRGGLGRMLAMGIALALALLLAIAGEARAGKYAVAQCGWYVGADADWADTTGAVKFRPDGYCVPPAGADPFDGAHLKSLTRDGQGTVSGTRFARWRWSAPAGTGITQVRGTWWHALHDGLEQRLGSIDWGGGFTPFLASGTTETGPAEFVAGFPGPVAAFEDRLLCARGESNFCSLAAPSWSAIRALTITLTDDSSPSAAIVGGDAAAPGWHRGTQPLVLAGADVGAGIRFAETSLDGVGVVRSEYPCAEALIGGEWRATAMRPCPLQAGTTHWIPTNAFSDGPHTLKSCHADFSLNFDCAPLRTLLIDNNSPAHPRSPSLAGGDGWRRSNEFDLSWANPEQAPGSPIVGAGWRLTGSAGFDTGARFAPGRDLATLADLTVPAPGAYLLRVWLRDEAGNEASGAGVEIPLRFDDVPPTLAFAAGDDAPPQQLTVGVGDPLSGPVSGQIFYRRSDSQRWIELPAKLSPADGAGQATMVVPTPELQAGAYLFRAEATDAAGNTATTTLRADGTQMVVRKPAPSEIPTAKTRLFARLGKREDRDGEALTVPFAASALLSGRLVDAKGAGIAGRELRVVSRPSRGALAPASVATVRTGERGGFELRLAPGTSRRIAVSFPGEPGLDAATRAPLGLRVRSGVSLLASPSHLQTGQVVRLSGRVRERGAPIPRRGKLVAIQYLEAETGRWRPVLVTRSDHGGRFHARYRFRYISAAASIQLRATALAEERWPYAPGSSSPVTVEVDDR